MSLAEQSYPYEFESTYQRLSLDASEEEESAFFASGSPSNRSLLGPSMPMNSRSKSFYGTGDEARKGHNSAASVDGFVKRTFSAHSNAGPHKHSKSAPELDDSIESRIGQLSMDTEADDGANQAQNRKSLQTTGGRLLSRLSPRYTDMLPADIEIPADYQLPTRLKEVIVHILDKDGNSIRSVRLSFSDVPSLRHALAVSKKTKNIKIRTLQSVTDPVDLTVKKNYKFQVETRFFVNRPIRAGPAVFQAKMKTLFKTVAMQTKLAQSLEPRENEFVILSPEYKVMSMPFGQTKVKVSLLSAEDKKLFAISFLFSTKG